MGRVVECVEDCIALELDSPGSARGSFSAQVGEEFLTLYVGQHISNIVC